MKRFFEFLIVCVLLVSLDGSEVSSRRTELKHSIDLIESRGKEGAIAFSDSDNVYVLVHSEISDGKHACLLCRYDHNHFEEIKKELRQLKEISVADLLDKQEELGVLRFLKSFRRGLSIELEFARNSDVDLNIDEK